MNIRILGGILAIMLMLGGFLLYGAFEPGGLFHRSGGEGHDPGAIDARLQSENPRLFGTLKRHFPDDYAAFIDQVAEMLSDDLPADEVSARSQAFVAAFRREKGAVLMRAPAERIAEIVALSERLHRAVREGEGRAACNAFAIQGPPALGAQLFPYIPDIEAQGALIFEAIAAARNRPPYADLTPAAPEDWDTALDRMVADGGTEADRRALTTLAPEEDICPALARLLATIQDMPDQTGSRLRATYVRDLAVN